MTSLISLLLAAAVAAGPLTMARPYIDSRYPVSVSSAMELEEVEFLPVEQLPVDDLMIDLSQPVVTLADVVPAASSTIAASSLTTNSMEYGNNGDRCYFGVSGSWRMTIPVGTGQQEFTAPYYEFYELGSMSTSGSVRTMSGTGSYSVSNGGGTTYTIDGYWLGGLPSSVGSSFVAVGGLSSILKLNLPAGVYSYQLSGSVTVSSTLQGQSTSVVIPCSQDIFSSIDPITICEVPFVIPSAFYSSSALSGTIRASVSVDLSNLNIYLNQTTETVLLTLPSGQYLNASGGLTSGTNVPAYTYLTEGLKGLGKDLMGTTGTISTNYYSNGASGLTAATFSSLGDLTSRFFANTSAGLYLPNNVDRLNIEGVQVKTTGNFSAVSAINYGIIGLNNNLLYSLTGSRHGTYSSQIWSFDEDLNKTVSTVSYSNILQAIAGLQSSVQQPLSQLQAVLANDEDLALRQKTSEEVDQVVEDFTGSGTGAPSVSNIGDIANVSGQMGDLFDSGVGVGDFFTAVNSSDSYQFFSQEVANDLDSTSVPAVMALDDEDVFEDLVLDDDGFYSLADMSFFSLSDFLGKGG